MEAVENSKTVQYISTVTWIGDKKTLKTTFDLQNHGPICLGCSSFVEAACSCSHIFTQLIPNALNGNIGDIDIVMGCSVSSARKMDREIQSNLEHRGYGVPLNIDDPQGKAVRHPLIPSPKNKDIGHIYAFDPNYLNGSYNLDSQI